MKKLAIKINNVVKLFLRVVIVMISAAFLIISGLILTHSYVVDAIKSVVSAAISNCFAKPPIREVYTHEENEYNTAAKEYASRHESSVPANEPISYAEVTNTITLMSKFIDFQAEYAMRQFRLQVSTEKMSSPCAFVEWLESMGLNESEIKKKTSKLLSENSSDRMLAMSDILFDIYYAQGRKNNAPQIWGTAVQSWKRWGVEVKEWVPFHKEAFSLENDQLLSVFIAAHFKAILYEEVQSILLETPKSFWNQVLIETIQDQPQREQEESGKSGRIRVNPQNER